MGDAARTRATCDGPHRCKAGPISVSEGSRRRARLEQNGGIGRERRAGKFGQPSVLACERRCQRRRPGQDRVCDETDGGADRAEIVGAGVAIRQRRRATVCGFDRCPRGRRRRKRAPVDMDVAERQDDLNRQREQRQTGSQPSMRSKPAHRVAHSPTSAAERRRRMLCYNMAALGGGCQARGRTRRNVGDRFDASARRNALSAVSGRPCEEFRLTRM